MSRQLTLSAAFSVVMMAAFALSTLAAKDEASVAESATGIAAIDVSSAGTPDSGALLPSLR